MIINGGISLSEFGCDLIIKIPAAAYDLFSDEELEEMRSERKERDRTLRELMELLDK